jgi:hypothetical protein
MPHYLSILRNIATNSAFVDIVMNVPELLSTVNRFNQSDYDIAKCISIDNEKKERAITELFDTIFESHKKEKRGFFDSQIVGHFDTFLEAMERVLHIQYTVLSESDIAKLHRKKVYTKFRGQKGLFDTISEGLRIKRHIEDEDAAPSKKVKTCVESVAEPTSTDVALPIAEEPVSTAVATPIAEEPVSTAAVAAVAETAVAVPVPIDIENAQKAVHMSVYALLKAHRSNKQPSTDIKDKIYALIHLQLQAGIRERDTSNIYTVPVEFKFDHININFNMETRKIAISVTPKNLSRAKFSAKRKTFPIGAA